MRAVIAFESSEAGSAVGLRLTAGSEWLCCNFAAAGPGKSTTCYSSASAHSSESRVLWQPTFALVPAATAGLRALMFVAPLGTPLETQPM